MGCLYSRFYSSWMSGGLTQFNHTLKYSTHQTQRITQTCYTCETNAFNWWLIACRSTLDARRSSFRRMLVLIQTCHGCHPNVCTLSFERVWLLVQTSRLNVFGFSFESGWLLIRTRPGIGSNSFIRRVNAFKQQTHYTLCLTSIVTYAHVGHLWCY